LARQQRARLAGEEVEVDPITGKTFTSFNDGSRP
jgi:hypothetical protein